MVLGIALLWNSGVAPFVGLQGQGTVANVLGAMGIARYVISHFVLSKVNSILFYSICLCNYNDFDITLFKN